VCALTAALGLGACGAGGGGIAAAASGGGGGGGKKAQRAPDPPRVDLTAPAADPTSSYVTFLYVLADKQVKPLKDDAGNVIRPGGEDDPRIEVFPEYSLESVVGVGAGGRAITEFGPWLPMTGSDVVGSDGTRALALGDHTFVWNTLVDVPAIVPPMTGRVRARLRAEYEPTAGLNRKFRVREVTFSLDNRLAASIFGGDIVERSDVDTFPVDLRPDGTSMIVAAAGAGIVESVDATGRISRVVGVGVPGTSGDGGDPGVARLEDLTAVAIDPATGLIYTNHGTRIRVTNPDLPPQDAGTVEIPGRTILSLIGQISGARSARVHPSGALLYIDARLRIFAFNMNADGDITLSGVTIPAGGIGQIAGDGGTDADGTPSVQIALSDATSLAVGPDGEIYYGEQNIGRIRVINPNTVPLVLATGTVAPGPVETVAGGNGLGFDGDEGPALAALLNRPDSLDCSDDRGLFIADTFNVRCRLVNLGAGDISFAGTTVSPGNIDTVAGGGNGGIGSRARDLRLGLPNALALGVQGTLLIADQTSVLLVNGRDSTVTAYGKTAQGGRTSEVYDATRRSGLPLNGPAAVHARGPDEVFFTDQSTVRVLNLRPNDEVFGGASAGPGEVAEIAGGAVPGFSGDGGSARAAAFATPAALATDGPFKLYVADSGNDRVRYVNIGDPVTTGEQTAFGKTLRPGNVDTIVGGGPPTADDGDGLAPDQASLDEPSGLAVFAGLLFVADTGHHRVRCVNPGPTDVVVAGTTVFANTIQTIYGDGIPGFTPDGAGPWLTDSPTALAVDSRGILYISETGNARVRALNTGLTQQALDGVTLAGVTIAANEVGTLVGTGVRGNFGDGGGGPEAFIDAPSGLLVQALADGTPVALYLSDTPQHVVRMLNLTENDIIVSLNLDGTAGTTLAGGGITSIAGGPNAFGTPNAPAFAGDGSEPLDMRFDRPLGITITNFDGRPAHFLVGDQGNDRLRRFGAPPIVVTSQ
jgi:hypothetical protein